MRAQYYPFQVKKVKAHTSQRPKRRQLIPVSLACSMPESIATPPGRDAGPSQLCPQQYVTGTHLYTRVKRDRGSKVPCLRKHLDGGGLKSGPPDPGFEVLTARPKTPLPLPLPTLSRSLIVRSDPYTFLGNCPPAPPLSQH